MAVTYSVPYLLVPAMDRLALGYGISLIGGSICVPGFLYFLRKYQGIGKSEVAPGQPNPVPPWLTGLLERLFFTTVVAFNVQGAAIAMISWLALKLATNWNRRPLDEGWSARAFSALLAGVVSMFFALVGGLACLGLFA